MQIFQGGGTGRAIIIANPAIWQLYRAPDNMNLVSIKGKFANRIIIVTCVYMRSGCSEEHRKEDVLIVKAYHNLMRLNMEAQHILLGDVNAEHWLWGAVTHTKEGNCFITVCYILASNPV